MKLAICKVKTAKNFNPRDRVLPADVEALAGSMKTVGQLEPILLRDDNELINGKHRLAAAKKLGWKNIEARAVKASDLEARILALVSNNFGKRLDQLELGRQIDLILREVGKRGGRGRVKTRLAKQLGLSVSELESCLATYRKLSPEARRLSSYAVRKGVLRVEQLRKIRQLPAEKQVPILKRIAREREASAADRLVSGFIVATQDVTEPRGLVTTPTATGESRNAARIHSSPKFGPPLPFLKLDGAEIVSLREESVWFQEEGGRRVNLQQRLAEALAELTPKVRPGDRLTVNIILVPKIPEPESNMRQASAAQVPDAEAA